MKEGQIGTVYKLLIGSAFAIALLVMVYNYTSSIQSPITGIDAAKDAIESASKAAPDKCFSRKPVHFQSGQPYTSSTLQALTGVGDVGVDSSVFSGNSVFKVDSFQSDLESSLSAECTTSEDCTLYLGSDDC